jgi:hypothetical protein
MKVGQVQEQTAPSSGRANTRMQSDRFALKIVAFWMVSCATRLRRLMRNPFGGSRKSYRYERRSFNVLVLLLSWYPFEQNVGLFYDQHLLNPSDRA